MKKLLIFLVLLFPAWAFGQSSWPPPLILAADPAGACANGITAYNVIAGTGFFCSGNTWHPMGGTGTGSVTDFSAGDLSPLFTTSVATSTTTPALSFTADTPAAFTFFANNTGGAAAASFVSMDTFFGSCSGASDALTYDITAHAVGCNTISPGSGTVTSVGLAGTANQITVTGASPITTSGSWTLSLPSAVTLPGTLAVTNGSGNGISFVNANGRVTGSGGGYLNFDGSGAATLASAGTNQNVTLTPSGTGHVTVDNGSATNNLTIAGATNTSVTLSGATSAINGPSGTQILMSGGSIGVRPNSGSTFTLAVGSGSAHNFINTYGIQHNPQALSCSGTCTITVGGSSTTQSDQVEISLTGAVTSVVLSGTPFAGERLHLIWIQDGTGETVSGFPAAMHGATAPGSTASTYSFQVCDYLSTAAIWVCGVANTNIP